MKTAAIIPIKKKSERVVGKNFRIIRDKPLYRYLLDNLKFTNFDEIILDSDSDEIKKYSLEMGYSFIERKPELKANDANGNHLLNYHKEIIYADYYFQLFITSPLLKIKTINECIKILKEKNDIDSILTVKSLYTWFWFDNNPVNYDPKILPRSQDAQPLVMETTGLYGITRNALIENCSRIGKKPYFYEVSDSEDLDIDNEKDLDYFSFYVQRYLTSSDN